MDDWRSRLDAALAQDRELAAEVSAGRPAPGPFAPFVVHQLRDFGLAPGQVRLPEHFRGAWEQAAVCFLGPHVQLLPAETAPAVAAGLDEYLAYYRERPEKRDPFGHYQAIMDGAPWLATELVHWPGAKDLALKVLKGPDGPAAVAAALDLTWTLLCASAVKVLVLTGNDALKWVLPRLGWQGGALPGVTQLHGRTLGKLPLPGAPGRELTVVASFHWSAEMPMFVRKVAGLEGRKVGEAISGARSMVGDAIRGALV